MEPQSATPGARPDGVPPSLERLALEELEKRKVAAVHGTSVGDLLKMADLRMEALGLLLEAESAFGSGESPGSLLSVEEGERKCDRALELLQGIRYPEIHDFAVRREVLEADSRRARALKAALGRWREIGARSSALEVELGRLENGVREGLGTVADRTLAAVAVVEQQKRELVDYLGDRRREVESKGAEVTTRAGRVLEDFKAFDKDRQGLVKRLAGIGTELDKEKSALDAWGQFVQEATRLSGQCLGDLHLDVITAVNKLHEKKPSLSPDWAGVADSLLADLKPTLLAARQARLDAEFWPRFTEAAGRFGFEVQQASVLGSAGEETEGLRSGALAEAADVVKRWPQVTDEPVLKKVAESLLGEMRGQKEAAFAGELRRRVDESRRWIAQAEQYLAATGPSPELAGAGGSSGGGAASSSLDPSSALWCLLKAEGALPRSLSGVAPGALLGGLEGEVEGLAAAIQALKAKAAAALSAWLDQGRGERIHEIERRILERRRGLERGDEASPVEALLAEGEVRAWADELAADRRLMTRREDGADDASFLQRLVARRRRNVGVAEGLLMEMGVRERCGEPTPIKVYRQWQRCRRAQALDPDSPEAQRAEARWKERWDQVESEFRQKAAACLKKGTPKGLVPAQGSVEGVGTWLGQAGDRLKQLRAEIDEMPGLPREWADRLDKISSYLDGCERLLRISDLGRWPWQRAARLETLLTSAEGLQKEARELAGGDLLQEILSLSPSGRRDRPAQAVRYAWLTDGGADPSGAGSGGPGGGSAEVQEIEEIVKNWRRSGSLRHLRDGLGANRKTRGMDPTELLKSLDDADRRWRRKRLLLRAGLAAALSLLGIAGVWWYSARSQPEPESMPAPKSPQPPATSESEASAAATDAPLAGSGPNSAATSDSTTPMESPGTSEVPPNSGSSGSRNQPPPTAASNDNNRKNTEPKQHGGTHPPGAGKQEGSEKKPGAEAGAPAAPVKDSSEGPPPNSDGQKGARP